MASLIDPIIDSIDSLMAWLSTTLKQTTESYCELQTADSTTALVAHDGSLLSVVRVHGVTGLMGQEEFDRMYQGLTDSLSSTMSRPGHAIQVYFYYDPKAVNEQIDGNYLRARQTAENLNLELSDLFKERVDYMSHYCAHEELFLVLWTRPAILTKEQLKQAQKQKLKTIRENQLPPLTTTQNIIAAIPDLRNTHDAFVRAVVGDLNDYNIAASVLNVHDAVKQMRLSVDRDFTDRGWRATLPGDKIPVRISRSFEGKVSDVMWPSLARQIIPRDAEVEDLRTVRVGDKIYSSVFIELFPKDVKAFAQLFNRVATARLPWRISFFIESEGFTSMRVKTLLASILSFSHEHNRLLASANDVLSYIKLNLDEAVVKLKVATATWAPEGDTRLLRERTAELAKAIEGWGTCEVSEMCGDSFGGAMSSALGVTSNNMATPSVAPFSDVMYMMPFTRPASPWREGAQLFRSPDGKPWPYHPGSAEQTTWIDLMYARPGSGKSVLSNSINLALCLSPGLQRLPRIAIIDIGPSSSGLISLLREALPQAQRHQVAYHRLRMTPNYSINPFDTQLGCRVPTAQERGFLVNMLSLLATPTGATEPYEGVVEMAGLVIDELYKQFADDAKPTRYTSGIEPLIDGILEEIGFVPDHQTTWWEVTDALFTASFVHEATLAQRYAMPQLADAAAIVRDPAVEDLYGKIKIGSGETLVEAFSRMISSAVREYPILSQVTSFDIGDARVVALDLDEVAKSGGDAAERQTAVMYMLARYVLARHFYLTEDALADIPLAYRDYHSQRIAEIREDPKRLVYDEFHRTSKARAVREQVIVDMREGRKWKVQVALVSQALDDFDPVMVEFATSIYIMDAGPEQSIRKSAEVFGLSETAQVALRRKVHGPKEGGATFLALYATRKGVNTQLLTATLGPVELWAFSTTADDANLRNQLYSRIGAAEARRVLATLFPSGSVARVIEERLNELKEDTGLITDEMTESIIDEIVGDIIDAYTKDPQFKYLPRRVS